MRSSANGFTVLEMIVAAGIAVMMMSLALVALTTTTRAHKRSRKLLIEQEEARSALTRIRRDVEGWFDAADDGSDFVIVHDAANNTDTLQLVCATENEGPRDYVEVNYYLVWPPSPPHPQDCECPQCLEYRRYRECLLRRARHWPFAAQPVPQVVARNVRRVTFESDGSMPPKWVKVWLSMRGEELSTSHLGSEGPGELYEIHRYKETVGVPAGR